MQQPTIVPLPLPTVADIDCVRSMARDVSGKDDPISDSACRSLYYLGFANALCDAPGIGSVECWDAVKAEIAKTLLA